jgi:hypothetical protein
MSKTVRTTGIDFKPQSLGAVITDSPDISGGVTLFADNSKLFVNNGGFEGDLAFSSPLNPSSNFLTIGSAVTSFIMPADWGCTLVRQGIQKRKSVNAGTAKTISTAVVGVNGASAVSTNAINQIYELYGIATETGSLDFIYTKQGVAPVLPVNYVWQSPSPIMTFINMPGVSGQLRVQTIDYYPDRFRVVYPTFNGSPYSEASPNWPYNYAVPNTATLTAFTTVDAIPTIADVVYFSSYCRPTTSSATGPFIGVRSSVNTGIRTEFGRGRTDVRLVEYSPIAFPNGNFEYVRNIAGDAAGVYRLGVYAYECFL